VRAALFDHPAKVDAVRPASSEKGAIVYGNTKKKDTTDSSKFLMMVRKEKSATAC
jgi:hypothetical protein